VVRRALERQQLVDMLAMHTQQFPRRREQMHPGRAGEDLLGKLGRSVDHMLAGVEDDQDAFVLQVGDEGGNEIGRVGYEAHRRSHGGGYDVAARHRREVHEPDPAVEIGRQAAAD
jgi:hypothetical protein